MRTATRVSLAVSAGVFAMVLGQAGTAPLFAQGTAAPQLGQKASGQQGGQTGQAKPGQAGQPQAASGPQMTADESRDYQAVVSEVSAGLDPDKEISLAQDFEKKYPNSVVLSYVYSLEASGHQQKGEVAQVVEAGEKSLKLNPDNLMSLIIVATVLPQPQLMRGNELDKEKKLTEAEADATHALELIEKLPKQPNEADDAFKKRKDAIAAEPHGALGMVHLEKATMTLTGGMDQAELAKSAAEFKQSVEMTDHPSAQNYYRLGEVYMNENKLDDSIAAFSKASELSQGTALQQYADQKIEELKKKQPQAKPAGTP